MITCKNCGWEVKQDLGLWLDSWGHAICYWEQDIAVQHEPQKTKKLVAA